MLNEALLHYIWEHQLISPDDLIGTNGQAIRIKQKGNHNFDSGPDFLDARIDIDDKLWAGHVEIHINASDWKKHGHQNDKAYNNVILHVVLNDDAPLNIPTLELKGKLSKQLLIKYQQLIETNSWIPCADQIVGANRFKIFQQITRASLERLGRKSHDIEAILNANASDWDETFYQLLLSSFGGKVNKNAYQELTKRLPFKILRKYCQSLLETEALLLGTAGFLEKEFVDDVEIELQQTFRFLEAKHNLEAMPIELWRFSKIRPPNFPTVRLAQMAALFHQKQFSLEQMLRQYSIKQLMELFKVSASNHWDNKYMPAEISAITRPKKLGLASINSILINVLAPLIYSYGKYKGEQALMDKAVELLESLPKEKNQIIMNWKDLGVEPKNAFDTQGLIQLKLEYCDHKKCLNCAVGNELLRTS